MNDPYKEGYEAFSKGLSPDDNPYREQPEDKNKWDEGWEDGKIDEKLKQRTICRDQP
jgi:ribosome modulation factor